MERAVSSLGRAALELAATGRPVFPLTPGTKDRPLTRWVRGKEFERASSDPRVVEWWWAKWPEANIGLPTGAGLVVVDVDPRNGGQANPSWPQTVSVRTPSGGLHFYFHHSGEVANSAGLIAPGIDVRGKGGMVVAPPSRTPAGGYEWVDPGAPIADLPPGLLVAATHNLGDDAEGTRFVPEQWQDSRGMVREGGRNNYLFKYSCSLYAMGASDLEVAQIIEHENAEVCDPPMLPHDVDRIIASARRYEL